MADDFEYLSNNLFISFPFKTPAPLVMIGPDEIDLGSLFADAHIFTSDVTPRQLRLKSLTLDTTTLPPTAGVVVLADQNGDDFITLDEVVATFRVEEYGRWTVVEWTQTITELNGLTGASTVIRFLLSSELLADLVMPLSIVTALDEGFFEDARIKQGPPRVTRFFLKIGETLFPVAGDRLILENGFNIEIKEKEVTDDIGFQAEPFSPSEVRPKQILQWNAVPGAGRGQFLRCQPRDVIRTLNGVGPNERGNVNLRPNECYWWEIPLINPPVDVDGQQVTQEGNAVPATLQLHNACVECCSCEAFAAAYQNLLNLWNRARAAAARIDAIRVDYADLIGDIGSAEPAVQVIAKSRAGFTVDVSVLVTPGADGIEAESTITLVLTLDPTPGALILKYIDGSGLLNTSDETNLALDPVGGGGSYTIQLQDFTLTSSGFISWTGSFRALDSGEGGSRTGAAIAIAAALTIDAESHGSAGTTIKLKPPEALD